MSLCHHACSVYPKETGKRKKLSSLNAAIRAIRAIHAIHAIRVLLSRQHVLFDRFQRQRRREPPVPDLDLRTAKAIVPAHAEAAVVLLQTQQRLQILLVGDVEVLADQQPDGQAGRVVRRGADALLDPGGQELAQLVQLGLLLGGAHQPPHIVEEGLRVEVVSRRDVVRPVAEHRVHPVERLAHLVPAVVGVEEGADVGRDFGAHARPRGIQVELLQRFSFVNDLNSTAECDYLDDSIFVFGLQQFIQESMGPGIDRFHDRRRNRVGIVVVGVVIPDNDRLGWVASASNLHLSH